MFFYRSYFFFESIRYLYNRNNFCGLSEGDKLETEKYISMNNRVIVRLTENELKEIMGKCVRRALIKEHIDMQREIKLAQQTLCKFPLSDVGLRLEGTQFYSQYQQMKDAVINLNNALIHYIRGEGKKQ